MSYKGIDDPVLLRRLMTAMLLIERDLELPVLLEHLVDEARSMTGARYGALGILNEDRTALAEFVTSGLTPEEEARIGPRPTGRGVLGILISDPRPLRLADIRSHPDSYGFPPHHPPMTSFLGVPVKVRDEVYGNLYLTEKTGWSEFTTDDENLVGALALAAGIAIENARLHSRVQELAVLDDRDRIARDLHDAVIQRLFAVGLSIQGLVRTATTPERAERLSKAVTEIDEVIRQIRATIFELGLGIGLGRLRGRVLDLLGDLADVVGFDVPARFEGPVDAAVPEDVGEHVAAVLREAVTNVGRHARATSASVVVGVEGGTCTVEVVDNGMGVAASGSAPGEGGLGLPNLRDRAAKLGGDLVVEEVEGGGTRLVWQVPLPG
ncbi:MAG: GAF domain-containing sensor histidine kinase [Acidimicrobiales bacterium]